MTREDWEDYIDDFLSDDESEEFYGLMQAYRNHPASDPAGVYSAFSDVKVFLGQLISQIR